jgi:hypothetical protein
MAEIFTTNGRVDEDSIGSKISLPLEVVESRLQGHPVLHSLTRRIQPDMARPHYIVVDVTDGDTKTEKFSQTG